MSSPTYTILSRQAGLMREFSAIANNIANSSTTGYKAERAVFSEFIARTQRGAGVNGSTSIGRLAAHVSDFSDGSLRHTGGALDLAITGEGFFEVQLNGGVGLTRAGDFLTDEVGRVIDPAGNAVLDVGGGEITIPPDASSLSVASDGTLSVDGEEFARFSVVAADPLTLSRLGGNYWESDATQPVETPAISSGFLEDSNSNPVLEMARMVSAQRFYDAGQSLLEIDNKRIETLAQTLRQSA